MSRPEKSLRSRIAALNENELSFADAFENAPHAMALVDRDGALLSVNRAFCRMLDFGHGELLESNVSSITHAADLETEWEQRQRLARADIGRYELIQRYVRKSGDSVWVRLSVSAARNVSSELAYFVVQAEAVAPPRCAATDDTDLEWVQRFGDATLSAMHEIGNTLTPLMVNTELIVEQTRSEHVREFAKEVFKAARRIAFTLRRLRRIDDAQPVAYLGAERMLDLRMIAPKPYTDDSPGSPDGDSLDSEGTQPQN